MLYSFNSCIANYKLALEMTYIFILDIKLCNIIRVIQIRSDIVIKFSRDLIIIYLLNFIINENG